MSTEVLVYGFETSNNMKVRVALGFKGIPYEFRTVDPGDREEIVRISGQHLTPVLVHSDRVLFDSAAILRYLDANFPDTPKLFGHGRDEQWEIEDWERFARGVLAGPMMEILHRRAAGRSIDDAMTSRCTAAFHEALAALADRLSDREWLVGDRMTAADITAACVLVRVRNAKLFPLPPAAEDISAWQENVMRFDGLSRSSP